MPIWKAILLGIIQGAAEFLPISSSGHLVIVKEILKVDLDNGGVFFDVMLHLGTLLAISKNISYNMKSFYGYPSDDRRRISYYRRCF